MCENPTTELNSTTESETWRDVVGYEGWYSVSSLGRVRRDARGTLRGSTTRAGRLLSDRTLNYGYRFVCLTVNGLERNFPVHRLVAEAFHGPRPEGLHINHIDGVKTNNHPSNLEYVTPKENGSHAAAMGLYPTGDSHWRSRMPERGARGETAGLAKLTNDNVRDIRKALANGEKGVDIAVRYGVSPTAISRINKGHTWHHVD